MCVCVRVGVRACVCVRWISSMLCNAKPPGSHYHIFCPCATRSGKCAYVCACVPELVRIHRVCVCLCVKVCAHWHSNHTVIVWAWITKSLNVFANIFGTSGSFYFFTYVTHSFPELKGPTLYSFYDLFSDLWSTNIKTFPNINKMNRPLFYTHTHTLSGIDDLHNN